MASTAPNYYEFYRKSSIGRTLSDTLEDLITDGTITPQLEAMILRHFDRVMTEILASKVKEGLTFKGDLRIYQFVDDVWNFQLKDVTFTFQKQFSVTADRLHILAHSAKGGSTN